MPASTRASTHVPADRDFETYLPHLLSRYQAGKLVPFVGSGLSLPICTTWAEFVRRLCERAGAGSNGNAGASEPPDPEEDPDVRVRRAYSAVRALKSRPRGVFEAAVRHALLASDSPKPEPSASMRALGKLWWPLVLTTNYDATFERAFIEADPGRQLAVVGRSPEDCQRVLTSFTVAGRPLLWALQGYLGNVPDFQLPERDLQRLETELVVGHEEYRRVTYRELHFRRAFADVFRHRSLLFLGAGLQESYLQELFGEVLETYGPSARPHYAFLRRGQVDVEFLKARFQIFVIEYDDHDQVRTRLDRLRQALAEPCWTPRRFAYGLDSSGAQPAGEPLARAQRGFEIIAGSLPSQIGAGECIAVSAGGTGERFAYSAPILELLQRLGVGDARPGRIGENLAQYPGTAVFAVRARSNADERSLMVIYEACLALFRHAESAGYARIHLQLIAAGRNPKSDIRTFPARFSLVQIARAWGDFSREQDACKACTASPGVRVLSVYVKDEYVYREVAIGRIDVPELLACPEIRFFCEILRDDGEVERRLFQKCPRALLSEVTAELKLDPQSWIARVSPSPGLEDDWFRLGGAGAVRPLDHLGIVAGSTLRIHRDASRGHRDAARALEAAGSRELS